MICNAPSCLFVHIPKTAGQSIEQVFLDLNDLTWANEDRAQLLLRPNTDPSAGPPRLAHLTASEYLQYGYVQQQAFDKTFKFAFVRNPWSRLVSEYRYKHSEKYDFRSFVLEHFPTKTDDKHSSGADNYRHVVPQVDFLLDKDGQLLVDFVGRFENLQADFDTVCEKLGIPAERLSRRNSSNALENSVSQTTFATANANSSHYSSFYDEETRAFVAQYYAADIERFGYQFKKQ